MRKSDFYFDLPKERIAQSPPENRGESRLLVLTENSAIRDCEFSHLLDLVQPNDLLVLNDTRVIPARLFGHKESGGKVELLVERVTGNYQLLAHVRASKAPKPGARLMLEETIEATVTGRSGALFEVQFAPSRTVTEWLELAGRMPLPPYIEREAADLDSERYQTVYARHKGAVKK